MNNELLIKFAKETEIPFSENEMLSAHTTFKIGGPAEVLQARKTPGRFPQRFASARKTA